MGSHPSWEDAKGHGMGAVLMGRHQEERMIVAMKSVKGRPQTEVSVCVHGRRLVMAGC